MRSSARSRRASTRSGSSSERERVRDAILPRAESISGGVLATVSPRHEELVALESTPWLGHLHTPPRCTATRTNYASTESRLLRQPFAQLVPFVACADQPGQHGGDSRPRHLRREACAKVRVGRDHREHVLEVLGVGAKRGNGATWVAARDFVMRPESLIFGPVGMPPTAAIRLPWVSPGPRRGSTS
jgi:hypothetical protein